MSDLVKRMIYTINTGIITSGDSFERGVAVQQFKEAIDRIEQLQANTEDAEKVIAHLKNQIEQLRDKCPYHDEGKTNS